MRVNVSSKERQSEQSRDRERDRLRAVPLSSCSECGTGLTTSWAEMDPWQSGAWNAHIYYVRGVACVNDMSLEYQCFIRISLSCVLTVDIVLREEKIRLPFR